MKMRFGAAVLTLLVLAFASFGQKPAPKDDPATRFPGLKAQSEALVKALFTDDYAAVVSLTYPPIVAANGGPDAMASSLKREDAELKEAGGSVLAMSVKEIRQVVAVGDQLFAVVTVANKIKANGKKLAGDSYLIGISEDAGANWKFINGFDQTGFDRVFPQAAGRLVIPDLEEPR